MTELSEQLFCTGLSNPHKSRPAQFHFAINLLHLLYSALSYRHFVISQLQGAESSSGNQNVNP